MRKRIILAIGMLCVGVGPAQAQAPPLQVNAVNPLPPQAPPWPEGYQVRWPVRVIGDPYEQKSQTVIVSLPTGGWLKPDASDLVALNGAGKPLPLLVLSHDPAGDTVVQFKRNGNDPWYWIHGVNPKAAAGPKVDPKTDLTFREGLTLEVRDWQGDDMTSWVKVRAGLDKSDKVIGNAIVSEVMQSCNPARPGQNAKFAASYRGFLDIKKDGTYYFFVNADDASFLFIDGFKVFERPGTNRLLGTVKIKELEKLAGKVDLKAGVHPFEVHQVTDAGPDLTGRCALTWTKPDQPKFSFVPPGAVVQPLYARAAATERPGDLAAGTFSYGIDDTLESGGVKLFLVRFEADGPLKETDKLVWDFGDGTTGTGRSLWHCYFKEGDYHVSLNAGTGLPPFRRKVHVWPEPGDSSPLSLELAVKTLEKMDWKKLESVRIREIFSFLLICDQPSRWALLDSVAQHLLMQKDLDLELKSQLYTARMEALMHQGRAADALKLAEQVRPEFGKTPALDVRIQLGAAAIHQYHFRDAPAASKIYKAILDEHSRTEHPNLRLAGIRWGDLFAEAGDLVKAADTYRIAATLGGEKFAGTAQTDATTRGALLRIAEQKLRAGDVYATRQLLERVEMDYPGRRLDGLYCFLRAESDRFGGRYEDALRHYGMIFKLPQWAGYKDRATYGIADCFYRMGELQKSLKWYDNLKEAYPKFHEEKKAAEMEKLIAQRLERIKAAKDKGNPDEANFKGYATSFEPEEKEWFGEPQSMAVVRAPTLDGSHALLIDVYPKELGGAEYNYLRPLKNLTPGGNYWVEIWYKDIAKPAPPLAYQQPAVQCRLISETPAKTEFLAGSPNLPRNNHHQWHKLTFKMKAPLEQDFQLKLSFGNITGAMLFDALTIRPISDRQLDSLTSFYEGPKTP